MSDIQEEFSRNLSILYRLTLKHFDNYFYNEEIGYAQLLFLTQIYEHEGITMNELVRTGSYDKGTVTKSLQKLEQSNYVEVRASTSDKRSRQIFTTEKCRKIITPLFVEKQRWLATLAADLSSEELTRFLKCLAAFAHKAQELHNIEIDNDKRLAFYGMQKISLVDYPGKLVSTLLLSGSNFRSPYATTRDYLFLNEMDSLVDEAEVIQYLARRHTLIDGICISGGEPFLYPSLEPFLRRVKELGLLVKIDTNGSFFTPLKNWIEAGLIDFVSLEILNTRTKYPLSAGVTNVDLKAIEKSIDYLLHSDIAYEFVTTLVAGFHETSDIIKIAKRIAGAKSYVLKEFDDRASSVEKDLHALPHEKMQAIKDSVSKYVTNVELRFVRER